MTVGHSHVSNFQVLIPETIKRIVIHYDEVTKFDVRGIIATNADTVKKDDAYLTYETENMTEIDEGIFQRPEFAVDMKGVMAIEMYRKNGDYEVRNFRKHIKPKKLVFNMSTNKVQDLNYGNALEVGRHGH